jgi:DNA-binding response OmpR family regulator
MAAMIEARLLLVDDDPAHLEALAERLTGDGFEVTRAASGAEALERLDEAWPDLVILDLMMPEMDGQALAGRIKHRADIPILVLSAVATADNKADLIAQFAEDYVTKPYDYVELVARIRRVLRRLQDQIPVEELALGDLTLVPRMREAIVRGRHVSLSPTESRFLATLAASMPRAVTTEQLLRKVWADSDAADPAYVWVTVRRLRQKLEFDADDPQHRSRRRLPAGSVGTATGNSRKRHLGRPGATLSGGRRQDFARWLLSYRYLRGLQAPIPCLGAHSGPDSVMVAARISP